ncbi:MAG TPA: molybdopterin oxidoreductase family protein [Aliidongia sp.]|uniref:molybdopterin oxidoreductase family protein n=1 Tax=Aliidongia sp. TaxID=1914230 RepID=UPI002DDD0A11|nr:molybdopterin oxidoreductase family protein [Aliidongia sp.]HEV2673568.1 molybdopterin oxidoreductase family protein [Aliidongia sp.]
MPLDIAHSVCPHDCPSTCALEVERIDARTIGRVHGGRKDGYTAGVVCAKVARYAERQHHPERLSQPLRRVGQKGAGRDAFEPISWDMALDIVADRFAEAARRHGPETVWPYFYAGTMGHVQRDGIDRLRNVMKYSRQFGSICVALSDAGWQAGVGIRRGVDSREIVESDLIVVWGGNPVATQVNLMAHIQRARKKRGAKLVVVDTYRTPTAEVADLAVILRPGTDAALACAMMHVAFKEGFADRDYMARYTDVPGELEAHVQDKTPAWAAAITGLPEQTIWDFARLYGGTKRAFIRVGYGFSRSRNGSAQIHAVTCLPAVTGAWAHQGGGALYSGSSLYNLKKTVIQGLDAADPTARELDMSRIGGVLTGDADALRGGPPVTAMLIQNTNPMVVAPDLTKVHAGFARDDLFVCVHEQFMTETAAMADIVLPATTFLEHDDIYTASGHTMLQIARKAVEPFGEARENHYVICELARRLGAEHPGFAMTPWQLIERTLVDTGLPAAETFLEGRGLDCTLSFEAMHFLDGFGHADGKFHFKADWSMLGAEGARLSALPDQNWVIDRETAAKPFRLVTAPARSFLNSTFGETPGSRQREGAPRVLIHADDLAALAVEDGTRLRLGNDRGSVVVPARAFEGIRRGVVVVEGIWPNHAFEEGIGINVLTSAEPGLPAGGAVFHDTAIWIRPAA